MKKQTIILLVLVVILIATLVIVGVRANNNNTKSISLEEAKAQVLSFVNDNLMKPGTEVSIKDAVEENGLYKVTVIMPDKKEIESYLTKDGKKFFPQVMDIEEVAREKTAATGKKDNVVTDVKKAEKSKVELFVMSYCPYGTQIEKGIVPAIEALGDKVDFELKFCDYAMHGKKEIDENLRQYCIQKNEPQKLLPYLNCFLNSEDSDSCVKEQGINKGQMDACVVATDKEYKVSENFKNKSTYKGRFPTFNVYQAENEQYGVSGSPTLVINGAKVNSGRDSATLLKTICAGYENPPEECKAELSSISPAPGFGSGAGGDGGNASCGS